MTRVLQSQDLLTSVPGIGPTTFFKFQKHGIERVIDLLRIFPTRYEDYRVTTPAQQTRPGERVTVKGIISDVSMIITKRRGFTMTKARLYDDSGSVELVWFNQPFIKKNIHEDVVYSVSGTCDFFAKKKVVRVSEMEEFSPTLLHTGRIVPYYSQTYGVTQKLLRSKIKFILETLGKNAFSEYLPADIVQKERLTSPYEFFTAVHLPLDPKDYEKAHYRIAYEELLSNCLTQQRIRDKVNKTKSDAINLLTTADCEQFLKNLSFTLTHAQERSINEISHDLAQGHPMNRLLLGDVGSGKTVVMAYALLQAYRSQKQSVVLVPTDTLAQQHFATLSTLLQPFGIKISLLSGTKNEGIETANVIVSTHAILYKKKLSSSIGLIIIDEQHKFGVDQRNRLIDLASAGVAPHTLFVSATPIPRSLALTIFGSLDISYIDELPPGRNPVKTIVVSENKRPNAYTWINALITDKHVQMYVVCPLIDESTNEKTAEKKSVTEELVHLQQIFPHLKIAAIHSREKNKQVIFQDFRQGKYDVLVSTTVIEVGTDVKNACIMFIENADRFGLAQLHQLRGRVGRSSTQSYCLLFSSTPTEKSIERLKALETTSDGFKLAEIDLQQRGSGDVFGLEQHGFSMYIEAYLFDVALLTRIKETARELLAKDESFNYNSLVTGKVSRTERTDINLN